MKIRTWRAAGMALALLVGCGESRTSTGGGPQEQIDVGPRADSGASGDTGTVTGDTGTGPSDTGGGPGDTGGPRDTGPLADAGATDAGGMGGMIPVPPMTTAGEWPDVEPNDTPETAVPVGMIEFALWMGFGANPNRIMSATDRDYYAFRTGDMNSINGLLDFQVCGSGALDLFDLYLYSVVNGRLGPELKHAATTTPSCETLATSAELKTLLMPQSIYVLEVRAAPGLVLGANTGEYSA